jgi:hypothetical protein
MKEETDVKKKLRINLERAVLSTNIFLKEVVSEMSLIILLRNVHPALRPETAAKLEDNGMITKSEASEFVKIIGR